MQIPEILTNLDRINKSKVLLHNIKLRDKLIETLIIDCDLKKFKSYFILNNKNIIENVNLNNIINSKFLTENGYFRIVYDLNTGICLCEAIDIIVNPDILLTAGGGPK